VQLIDFIETARNLKGATTHYDTVSKGGEHDFLLCNLFPVKDRQKGDQGGFYGGSFDFLCLEIYSFKRLKCYQFFNFIKYDIIKSVTK